MLMFYLKVSNQTRLEASTLPSSLSRLENTILEPSRSTLVSIYLAMEPMVAFCDPRISGLPP